MSDRMYLHAIPADQAALISELWDTPSSFPFKPYVADGILHTSGSAIENPRYWELYHIAQDTTCLQIVSWPGGALADLWWRWNGENPKDFDPDYFYERGVSKPHSIPEIRALLMRQLSRSQVAGDIDLSKIEEVTDFLREHKGEHLYLLVG